MGVVSSLPPEPLSEKQVHALNDADALELAVPAGTDDERARGIMLATDDWLRALAFVDGRWRIVGSYDLAETARIDALQAGEDAIEAALED